MTTENRTRVPENGEPQGSPVWFGPGEHVKFSQTKTRQECKNLGREPHLALSIVDPETPNNSPGDERPVVFVRPERTTRKDR